MAKNDPRPVETNRTKAIQWFNQFSSGQKTQLCDTNTEIVGCVRRWETLTGLEIEKIYIHEMLKCSIV
jgi:hypothetical protein